MSGEENLALIRQIEEHRAFLLTILCQNPALLARAEPRVRELLEPLRADRCDTSTEVGADTTAP